MTKSPFCFGSAVVGEGGSSAAVTLLSWSCRTRQTPRAGHHTRWGPRGGPGRYQGTKGTSLSSTGQGLRWHKGPKEGGSGCHQAQPTPEQVLCPRAAAVVSLMGSAQAAPGSALAHLGPSPCSQPWSPRAAKWPSRWKNSEQQTPLGRFFFLFWCQIGPLTAEPPLRAAGISRCL